MALKQDIGLPCLNCSNCNGFKIHGWRKICTECLCSVEQHDISDDSALPILDELKLTDKSFYNNFKESLNIAEKLNKAWLPSGIAYAEVDEFLSNFSENLEKPIGEKLRKKKIRLQIPVQDRCVEKFCHLDTAVERQEAEKFLSHRNNREISVGFLMKLGESESIICVYCNTDISAGSLIVNSEIINHQQSITATPSSSSSSNTFKLAWHPSCFKCTDCNDILVDYVHVVNDSKIFCVRHHSQNQRPRCHACDELIFSTEFVKNNDENFHLKHFACAMCDSSIAKSRYLQVEEPKLNVLRNICLSCYDTKLANKCTACSETITSEARDISYRSMHWHPTCFKCTQCSKRLEGESFGFKDKAQGNADNNSNNKLLCADCYKELVVPKCYGCNKPAEYDKKIVVLAEKSWHYECFQCVTCKKSIGSENFVETVGGNVCAVCYEKEYAKKCFSCAQVIKESGVLFKEKSYHYDCFTCCNCKAKLSDVKFNVKNTKFYCKACNDDLFAQKCCKCSNVITGDTGVNYIKFQEKCWHSNCFNCTKCNETLVEKSFLTKEKDILCSQCGA